MSDSHSVRNPTLALDLARRLDPLCDRFEDELLAGRRPRLEDFLDGVPASDRPALLRELLALELEFRARGGDQCSETEYRQRFPDYAADVEAVFVAPPTACPEKRPSPTPSEPGTSLASCPAVEN